MAGLDVEVALIRIERLLARKYDPDQPREPAGRPGGGRWTSRDPSGDGSPADGAPGRDDPETTGSIGDSAESRTQEEAVTADGSRVLTIRIRSNPQAERLADWDEQHVVTAPDGTTTLFENDGPTQTIRDGDTGEILGRSRLTAAGAVPEAFVQPARDISRLPNEFRRLAARTLEAAASVFAALSDGNSDKRRAVFAAPESEYVPGDAYNERAVWVGAIGQQELDELCPRNGEVQALAASIAASVRASGNYIGEQDFGNKVHLEIADIINKKRDPDFRADLLPSVSNG